MPDYLDSLKCAVEAMHACPCSHAGSSRVHETLEGKTVWQGEVETFDLVGHPQASKAYAWGYRDHSGEIVYLAVLNVPPINSPREAVQAAIASGSQR